MPYIIIVEDSNELYGSHKIKLMQREKMFNKLWILVPQYYNGYDMSQCTVTMRYRLPISREFKTETLELSSEKYKDHLKYVLPIDTNFSKEWGDVELNLTFTMLDVDSNGNIIQRVRKTDNHILHITQLPDWDNFIPDSALQGLDQRILKQDAQIRRLADLAEILEEKQVDNLVYDDKDEFLQLSANGLPVGDKVFIKDVLDEGIPVVDFDSDGSLDGDHKDDCDCDCGCEDNIVEFGYGSTNTEKPEIPTDEDNVVEF